MSDWFLFADPAAALEGRINDLLRFEAPAHDFGADFVRSGSLLVPPALEPAWPHSWGTPGDIPLAADPKPEFSLLKEITKLQAGIAASSPADAVFVLEGKVYSFDFKIPEPRPVVGASDPYAFEFDKLDFRFQSYTVAHYGSIFGGLFEEDDRMDMPAVERSHGEAFFERRSWTGYP